MIRMLPFLFVLLPCFACFAVPEEEKCVLSESPLAKEFGSLRLSNGIISADVIPGISTLTASFCYLPEKLEVIPGFTYTVEKEELLPDVLRCASTGGRELLWGVKFFYNVPWKVLEKKTTSGKVSISMENEFFMSEDLSAVKTVSLEKGDSKLRILFEISNKDRTPKEVMLWTNMIPRLGTESMDPVLIPAKGGLRRSGKVTVSRFPEDALFEDVDPGRKEIFAAPSRSWLARRSSERKGIFVIRTGPELLQADGGFFYTWKRGGNSPDHTMEIVFPAVKLEKGKPHAWTLEYLYFPSLKNLSEICGDYGLFCHFDGSRLMLELESASPQKEQSLRLFLTDAKGNRKSLPDRKIPALCPGHLLQLNYSPDDLPKGRYTVSGEFTDGNRFTLLSPVEK